MEQEEQHYHYFRKERRMLKSIKSVAKLFILVAIVCPCIGQAAGPNQNQSKYIMVSTVATGDIELSSRSVSGVTSDDRFASVIINPSAKITQGNKELPLAQLTSGLVLNCKGTWDENAFPPTFHAEYVFVGKRLQDFEVRERVSAACKTITAEGNAQRTADPRPVDSPASEAKEHPSTPIEEEPVVKPKKEELPPQIEITKFEWEHGEGYGWVSCTVKNISDMPLAGLAATVDLYNDDDEYIASSPTVRSLNAQLTGSSLRPDKEDGFDGSGPGCPWVGLETHWDPEAFPGISQCKIRFQSSNLGALRLHPADDIFRSGTLIR